MGVSRIALLLSASLCVATGALLAPQISLAQGMPPGAMRQGMDMDDDMPPHGYGRQYYDYGYEDMPYGMMGPGMGMGMGPGGAGMGMEGMGPGGAGMGMMAMLRGLDLTDEQRKQIRQITRDLRSKHWAMMEQRMTLMDQLDDAYSASDKPDPAKIADLYGKSFELRKQMIQDSIEVRNKIYDLLTAEQREQLKSQQNLRRQHRMLR